MKDGKLNFRVQGFEQQATEEQVNELFTELLVKKMLERYNMLQQPIQQHNVEHEIKRVLA